MVNAVVLLFASPLPQPEVPIVRELHLASVVPGPSKSQFDIYINGSRVQEIRSTRKLNLTPHLRSGLNKIDIWYDAWNGKFGLFHPSTLKLSDGSAKGARELAWIRANIDNPRGSHRVLLRFEPSTPR